jgi:hypothetical protein
MNYLEDFTNSAWMPFAGLLHGQGQAAGLDLYWGTNPFRNFLPTIDQLVCEKRLEFGGSSAGLAVQGTRAFPWKVVNGRPAPV